MSKPYYRAVIISPHLDDAVFSCGGSIASMAKEGPVLVINIFTRYLSDLKFHGIVMGDERIQEEKDAAKFLGYESRNLDELDAIYRHAEYQKISNIFKPPIPKDMVWLQTLREKIFLILNEIEFQEIFIPLGVGWHVDHLMAHQVFEPWFSRKNLLFYEDLPYGTIPHTVRYRLNEVAEFKTEAKDKSLESTHHFLAWWQASRTYNKTAMMKNLKPWYIRFGAVPTVSIYLYRLFSFHRRQAKFAKKLRLQPQIHLIDQQFEQKVEGMALYQTQFREFFFSKDSCAATLMAYANRMNCGSDKAERFWRPS